MAKLPQGPTPAQGQGDPNKPEQAVWINVAESNSEYSDLRCSFEIKADGQMGPGRYIAWLKWKEEWGKWSGILRQDQREEWDKKLQQSNEPPRQPPVADRDDIPF